MEEIEVLETKESIIKKIIKTKKYILILTSIIIILLFILIFFITLTNSKKNISKQVITVSTLEDIINVSELSTFQAIYNGVCSVNNKENPEEIDYHVSYNAIVKVGINFEDVKININESEKKVTASLPDIKINNVSVDIASLDFIFQNDKSNTQTISESAYKACIADVEEESSKEKKIYDLASQNAKNIIRALIEPFIDQIDSEYKIEVS